jgi:hypothetical protein
MGNEATFGMATTIFDAYAEKHSVKAQQPEVLEFYCTNCKSKLAAIFHEDGDFCTECWQIVTHPNIEYHL